jgi:hypothetical protein
MVLWRTKQQQIEQRGCQTREEIWLGTQMLSERFNRESKEAKYKEDLEHP